MIGDGIDDGRADGAGGAGNNSGAAGTTDDWRSALSEEVRGHPALQGFDGVDALAREHVHLQRLIGRKGIVPPGEDAGEEERARFYEALGRPAAPADYEVSDPPRPEGMPWNEQAEGQKTGRAPGRERGCQSV